MAPEAAAVAALRPTVRIGEDSVLRALDPVTRRTLSQQLQMIQLLQDRPVVLISPYVVTVR